MKKPELFICACHSTDHQLIFLPFEDKEHGNEVFVHVHLVSQPFWKRLRHGIKYIFGHKSRFGDFDEMILNKDHAKQLLEMSRFLDKEAFEKIIDNTSRAYHGVYS